MKLQDVALVYGGPALMVVLGLPLALRWIPPNSIYGFRSLAVLSSPELWFRVNAFTGLALVVVGCLVAGAKMFLLLPMIFDRDSNAFFAWSMALDLLAVALVVALAWLYARG